jgi:hypothetical protein
MVKNQIMNLIHDLSFGHNCPNYSLGFMTKARAYKLAGQEREPENEKKCEGMNP